MGKVLVLDRWAPSCQGNSQLSLLLHSAIQRRHDERENNDINRLDKLGNTSRRRRRWWSPGTTNDGGGTNVAVGDICSRWISLVELSSGPAAQSRHHLRTVQTTAEGAHFSGSMNRALCDF